MIARVPAHLALRNRLLTVSGLPASRAWENKAFTPSAGTPYLTDEFAPATSAALSVPVKSAVVEERGLYVVTLYGLANDGISTIGAWADAILAAFAPGTAVTSTANDVIRVRSDVGPFASQIIPMDSGFAVCTIRIPWYAHSQNVIAA